MQLALAVVLESFLVFANGKRVNHMQARTKKSCDVNRRGLQLKFLRDGKALLNNA